MRTSRSQTLDYQMCLRDGHFLHTSCGSPNYAAPEVRGFLLIIDITVDVVKIRCVGASSDAATMML